VEGRKYKYTANIAFDVIVTLHPTYPKGAPEVAKDMVSDKKYFSVPRNLKNSEDGNIVANFFVTLSLLIIGTVMWQSRVASAMSNTTTTGPFLYQIDMQRPGHKGATPGTI
jgi:hypothetical protein